MDIYNPKMQIRELPSKIYKELSSLLEMPGEKDWKALVSVLPDGIYSKIQVEKLENVAQNNESPAEELLGELGSQSITVKELICYLALIDHQEALRLLEPTEILVQNMVLTAEEENFIKITKIILDILPKYLRKLFVYHWDNTYPNHKWQSENLTVQFLISRVPKACRHLVFVKKMKEESIQDWGSAALAFAFTDCGHHLIEGGRSRDKRLSPLRLSEELDIIRKIHIDFCSNPSISQCSETTFTNVASQMRSLAINVLGTDAEREINEIITSQMATDITMEQLKQQLRKEGNPNDGHEKLFKDLMFTMILSAEEENFIKITKIILEIVPKYLRKLFVNYWSIRYSFRKWLEADISAMMFSTVTPYVTCHDIQKRQYFQTMRSVVVGEWNISTLLFAFLESGMDLVKGCRPLNRRRLPLRVSEEIDVIRMVRKDFFADPSSMQCSSVTFTEVTSKIKSVARNIFDVDAENEIDEVIRSKITTTLTIEQLRQQLSKKHPIDEREK